MVADGMLTRKRYREVPPRVDDELTDRARELMPVLGELARWGYEWAWSTPRDSEAVDLGAIFRLAPGLFAPGGMPGTVEFVVQQPRARPASFTFTIADDGVEIEEGPAQRADAKVTGMKDAWVAAFSPDRDRSGLEITGEDALAETLLDVLAGAGSRAASVHAA
jgi:HxlR-like helix-turn-helix